MLHGAKSFKDEIRTIVTTGSRVAKEGRGNAYDGLHLAIGAGLITGSGYTTRHKADLGTTITIPGRC